MNNFIVDLFSRNACLFRYYDVLNKKTDSKSNVLNALK